MGDSTDPGQRRWVDRWEWPNRDEIVKVVIKTTAVVVVQVLLHSCG
ncbi:hypothetical protein ACU635_59060 [[Actinomadura] parvosata]